MTESTGQRLTNMVKILDGFVRRALGWNVRSGAGSSNEIVGQSRMAQSAAEDDSILVRPLDGGEAVRVSLKEVFDAIECDQFSPGVEIINSDIANDPVFAENIRKRLAAVGNNCFGDVGAELERSPQVSEFSLSLVDAYFDQKPS